MINSWDDYDFSLASATLLSMGISTHHLKDESAIATMCNAYAIR